jgi:hypothetical protein
MPAGAISEFDNSTVKLLSNFVRTEFGIAGGIRTPRKPI